MVHLLYGSAHPSQYNAKSVLTYNELFQAGVHCNTDTYWPLIDSGIVEFENNEYSLSKAAREMIRSFTVAKAPEANKDIRVDYPEVFVVMPFKEPYSDNVYNNIFEPAIKDAGFIAACQQGGIQYTDVLRQIIQDSGESAFPFNPSPPD